MRFKFIEIIIILQSSMQYNILITFIRLYARTCYACPVPLLICTVHTNDHQIIHKMLICRGQFTCCMGDDAVGTGRRCCARAVIGKCCVCVHVARRCERGVTWRSPSGTHSFLWVHSLCVRLARADDQPCVNRNGTSRVHICAVSTPSSPAANRFIIH